VLPVFYDLADCPLTFDAAVLMTAAESYARREGLGEVVLYIVPADTEDGFRWISPKDKKLPVERKRLRLEAIVCTLAALFPGFSRVQILKSRDEAARIREGFGRDAVFPLNWSAERKSTAYHMDILFRLSKAGIDVQNIRVPKIALDWAARKKKAGRKLAVITLRQSDMQPARNSNLAEWQKVRQYLEGKGYRVVTVPDTEALLSGNHGPWDGELSQGASVDIIKRAALYETADLNLMVCGGFAVLASLNPRVPFLLCNMICDEHKTTKREWLERLGFEIGRDPPWFQPHQRILWTPDTFDNLKPELERLTA
jgi:hypothetical protein